MLDWDRSPVCVRPGLVRVSSGQVDDLTARIDLALQHNVAGGIAPSFAHIQFTIGSRCTDHQAQVADEGVRNGDARQCLVAGVLHRDGVADHFACGVGGATRNGGVFGDVEARGLLDWDRSPVCVRPGLV